MRQPIQLNTKTRSRASAFQIIFPIALSFFLGILLASAAPTNPKETFGQNPLGGPTLGNYPDTSLPLSSDTTVTPDAPPTNTTSINVSTSTDFKGTLAGDPTTGGVRVTNAHPAGIYKVTVRAFDSGGATATKRFALTVTTPVTCLPVGFARAINYVTGDYPHSVAVGDFNGDGKQDLAVGDYDSDVVAIWLGDGTGNFRHPRLFLAGDNAASVAVGDFNGDGKQDLAVANRDSDTVSILLGHGNGRFRLPTNFDTGFGAPDLVAVGDFNRDGKQDLALVLNSSPGRVSILLGDGTGNFTAPTNFTVGDQPGFVAVGDSMPMASKILPLLMGPQTTCRSCYATAPVSQITPAGTTCSRFSSGTAENLGSVQYNVNNGLINPVRPLDSTSSNTKQLGTNRDKRYE